MYKTWGEYVKLVFPGHFLGVFPINSSDVSCDASCFTPTLDLKSSYQADMNVLVTGKDPFRPRYLGQRQLGSNCVEGSKKVFKPRTMTKNPI